MCHRCQGPGIGLFVVDVLDSQESLRQNKAAKPAQADAQDSEVKCRLEAGLLFFSIIDHSVSEAAVRIRVEGVQHYNTP